MWRVLYYFVEKSQKTGELFSPVTEVLFSPGADVLFSPAVNVTEVLFSPVADVLFSPAVEDLFRPTYPQKLFSVR